LVANSIVNWTMSWWSKQSPGAGHVPDERIHARDRAGTGRQARKCLGNLAGRRINASSEKCVGAEAMSVGVGAAEDAARV
jgi:hypothetical protein